MALNDNFRNSSFHMNVLSDPGLAMTKERFCFVLLFNHKFETIKKMHLYSWFLFLFWRMFVKLSGWFKRFIWQKFLHINFFLDLHFQFNVEKYVCHNNKRNSFRQNYYCKYHICGVFCSWTYNWLFYHWTQGRTKLRNCRLTTNLSRSFRLSAGS